MVASPRSESAGLEPILGSNRCMHNHYNMSKFVNMTPHPINLFIEGEGGKEEILIEPCGKTIRLKENWSEIKVVNGVPITHCSYTSEVDLPDIEEGVYYIVSAMVANAFPDRNDFLIPAQTIRDEKGRIVGCTSLAVVNYSWI